jgi:hypothetical protein
MAYDCCPRWPVVIGVEEERAAVEFGSGARELAMGLKEWSVEVGVVLMCARDRGLRLCGGLSTATRRWQPADARGSRGARRRTPGERNRTGRGRGRCVDAEEAGGGRRRPAQMAAGGEALPAAEQNRAGPTCARKKKRGEGSGGLV